MPLSIFLHAKKIRIRSSVLLLFSNLGGNTIHVSYSLFSKGLAHDNFLTIILILGDTNKSGCLKLDQTVSDVFSCGLSSVFSSGAIAVGATIVLAKTLNSNLLSHVDLVSNAGCAGVKPIIVLRSKFLEASSLYVCLPLLSIIN